MKFIISLAASLHLLLVLLLTSSGDPLETPGLQPSSGLAYVKRWNITGQVVQKLPEGLLLNLSRPTSKAAPLGLVYLEGDFPQLFKGSTFKGAVVDAGTFTYVSTSGSLEIVRKFIPSK